MAKPGRLAALIVFALLLVPATASACPTKRHVVHDGGKTRVSAVCTDTFQQQPPCPGPGQSFKIWADEEIPRGADRVFINYNFFGGGCPNATVAATTNPNASADPDGTPLHPKPGKQIAQLVLTETGTGPGGQSPTIGVTVTFTDPLPGPLKITKIATHDPLKAQPLKSTRAHLSFIYSIEVVNPGPFPARVHVTDQLPDAFTAIGKPATSGGTCAITRHELSCDSDIPPGKARLYAVHGRIDRAGTYVNTATATATADGLPLRPVSAEASLKVT